jgi:hypothetical protein
LKPTHHPRPAEAKRKRRALLHNLPQLLADSRRFIVENVAPDAIRSMHAQIVDRSAPGDGDLAARLLEKIGVLDGGSAPIHNIADDPSMQVLNALFPARPAAAATVSVKIETGSAPQSPSNLWPLRTTHS